MYEFSSTPNQRPLPTMYDLPSEEIGEPGLPDEFHRMQAELLRETCRSPRYSRKDVATDASSDESFEINPNTLFIASDLNLYYDSRNTQLYKRPDWFLCLDVPKLEKQADLRWSYLIWKGAEDLGETVRRIGQPPRKWEVYEQFLRVPYYALYDRYDNNFRLFKLDGPKYQEVNLSDSRFWFEELELGLAIWSGRYEDADGLWLRWYTAYGQWVPTELERAEQAEARMDVERKRAEQAEAKYQALLKKLQEQGMDMNDL